MSASFERAMLDDADRWAIVLPATALFGLLTRTFDLPPFWAALTVDRGGMQRVHAANATIEDSALHELLLVRTTAATPEVPISGLASRDGFAFAGTVTLSVRALINRVELLALREHLVAGRHELHTADLADYVAPSAQQAVAQWVGERDAAALQGTLDAAAVTAALAGALQAPLFKAGLELVDCRLLLDSPAYAQHLQDRQRHARRQAEATARADLQAARATARRQHVTHLAALLDELERLTEATPHADLPTLIRSFESADRGALYGALWTNSEATPTSAIVVAAGNELVYVAPSRLDAPERRITLPESVGAVRSLARCTLPDGTTGMAVGCATGVHIVDAVDGTVHRTLAAPPTDRPVRGGFNAVTVAGQWVIGSHSELGLLCWSATDQAHDLLRTPTANAEVIRHACYDEGAVWCSIDDRVYRLTTAEVSAAADTGEPFTGADAAITAICPRSTTVLAGTADGRILQWDVDRPAEPSVLHRGAPRPVETVVVSTAAGIERLCFTDTSTAVHAKVLGDPFSCRFEAGGQTLRRAEIGPDCIVATNETRDRLFHWLTAQPGTPPTVIPFGRWIGRSVQDVCLW